MELKEPDKRALRALFRYDVYATGAYEPESLGGLPTEDYEHAISEGLLFRPDVIKLDHDQLTKWLLTQVNQTTPAHQTDFFLASLSSGRLEYRAGLPAYAAGRHLSAHEFHELSGNPYCQICGSTREENLLFRNLNNRTRFELGGLVSMLLGDFAFCLERQNELPPVKPISADFRICAEVFSILSETDSDETAKKTVSQRIRKIPGFKSTAGQTKCFLETLGYCGILETEKHGGLLDRFVRLSTAPRKTHSSDWEFPVDFWTGKDGLNKKALRFWFGRYPELSQFTL